MSRFANNLKNQRGAVLVIAIFVITLIALFIFGLLDVVLLEAKSSANSERQQQMYYKAFSTMSLLAWKIKTDQTISDGVVDLGEMGSTYVKVEKINVTGSGKLKSVELILYPSGKENTKPSYFLELSDKSGNGFQKKARVKMDNFYQID